MLDTFDDAVAGFARLAQPPCRAGQAAGAADRVGVLVVARLPPGVRGAAHGGCAVGQQDVYHRGLAAVVLGRGAEQAALSACDPVRPGARVDQVGHLLSFPWRCRNHATAMVCMFRAMAAPHRRMMRCALVRVFVRIKVGVVRWIDWQIYKMDRIR